MSEKVQKALELLYQFENDELEEFALGMGEFFHKRSEINFARGSVKAAKVTPEFVWEKLTSDLLKNSDDKLYYHYREALERGEILSDLKEVNFNLENIELDKNGCYGEIKTLIGPRMFGKIAGVGCQAGGDWEWPVFFIIYLGVDGVLHGYFPKDGNMYNQNNDSAFGNDGEGDEPFLLDWLKINRPEVKLLSVNPSEEDGDLMLNEEMILKDITTNLLLAE